MEKQEKINQEEKIESTEEQEAAQGTDEQTESKEVSLEELVLNLKEQNDELQDKLLRQMAENQNVRNRSSKSIEEARDYAIFAFAKDLIPVIDNLSRALEHMPEDISNDMKNLHEGVQMTKSELESVFSRNSLEAINPEAGDKFDYNAHHAISNIESKEHEDGTIVETMQVGYKIKARLIRPAAVTVAKNK